MSLLRAGGNRKRYQQWTHADQKSIGTVFSIANCRLCGDKWQSKTLFLTIFDLRSSIVLVFSIAAYPVWSYGKMEKKTVLNTALKRDIHANLKQIFD